MKKIIIASLLTFTPFGCVIVFCLMKNFDKTIEGLITMFLISIPVGMAFAGLKMFHDMDSKNDERR